MKRSFLSTLLFLCTVALLHAAKVDVQHVHPLHWWVGMKQSELQILIHGKNVGQCTPTLSATDVQLIRTETTANPNYLLLYVDTRNARPQTFDIVLRGKGLNGRIPYTLKPRTPRTVDSFTSADVMYLLMPDRFANGNLHNDNIPHLLEPKANRTNPDGRHGGDLAGIARHLDYLADLGITALWPTPVQVNNQKSHTYHGYAITDYYRPPLWQQRRVLCPRRQLPPPRYQDGHGPRVQPLRQQQLPLCRPPCRQLVQLRQPLRADQLQDRQCLRSPCCQGRQSLGTGWLVR